MEPNPVNTNPVPPVEPERPRRRSVVGPVILILLGLAFLTHNLGIFTFNIWELMWKLWPLWLVAVGLDMIIGRRTSWGSWIVLGLVLAVIGGAVWLGEVGIYFGAAGGPAETVPISADLSGATRARVEIAPSIGELRLRAASTDGTLVEGFVNRLNGERLDSDYSGSGGDVTFILKSHGVSVPSIDTRRNGGLWDLKLAKNVSLDLKLGTGIGKSEVDLTDLTLNRLEVNTGIGETELTLPAKGNFQVTMQNGIGQTTLRIPKGMEARVHASKGIGAIDIYGDFTRDGNSWTTSGYGNAENQVDVDINGGIGEIGIYH
ncbi:MAG TPA: LiaF domain-containing protein [Symbiobacteriaceae bacterium]|nr:LiaF domain-containing protein [Symbiobacteriaceae bacterium]